ncbi:MAG: hypothetical protein KF760_01140 [Candidatus Eremiobacteraeota bacterium]|nr:hypothetical protein [Candidatus Eremiobacteraeota bacterium]MCW5868070.1 hypothetical protein [Candidatus Eremiobacteraeota bacterium]
MKRLLLSAALAALTCAGPAMAQDQPSTTDTSAPAPNVNVQVDAPAAPAAPAPVQTSTSTVEKNTTIVDRQTDSGPMDNTTLGLMAGIGVIGAAFLIGLAASNRA